MSDCDPFALAGPEAADYSAADSAQIAFEPIDDLEGVLRTLDAAPWKETTDAIGIDLRIATFSLGKTKPEMVEAFRALGDDGGVEVMDSLNDTVQRLRSLADLAAMASMRFLIAASVVAIERNQGVEQPDGSCGVLSDGVAGISV